MRIMFSFFHLSFPVTVTLAVTDKITLKTP
nr:MAG TPA: hypothetical protein [Caudoviricetes sp.]